MVTSGSVSYPAGTVNVVVEVVGTVVVVVVAVGCAVSIKLPTLAWPQALLVPTPMSYEVSGISPAIVAELTDNGSRIEVAAAVFAFTASSGDTHT